MRMSLKKISLSLILLTLVIVSSFAQKQAIQAPEMPVDESTKLITYTGVVEVKAMNKNELYKRGLEWFNVYYKNPSDVIREKDSINFKIVGKSRFKIFREANENGVKMDGGLIQYTIMVICKDGRFKYELTAINWKQQSYYPIEKWIAEKERYKEYSWYLSQTDTMMKEVVKNLETAMKTTPKANNKDNW